MHILAPKLLIYGAGAYPTNSWPSCMHVTENQKFGCRQTHAYRNAVLPGFGTSACTKASWPVHMCAQERGSRARDAARPMWDASAWHLPHACHRFATMALTGHWPILVSGLGVGTPPLAFQLLNNLFEFILQFSWLLSTVLFIYPSITFICHLKKKTLWWHTKL